MSSGTAKQRYQELKPSREDFLTMARECAALTIPSLLPPEGHAPGSQLPQPYQSLGARGVTNLSSRIMVAMYPPGLSSFRLTVPAEALMQSGETEPSEEAAKELTQLEKIIEREMERAQWRKPTHTTIQYLLVTGNALERVMPDNSIKVHRIDQYVVVRDPAGNMIECVIEEQIARNELPENLRGQVAPSTGTTSGKPDKVYVYTHAKLNTEGLWDLYQEADNQKISDTEQTVTNLPFIALRWTPVIGESYGRGKCEEHIADLRTFDAISQAALEGAAMASRNINMIRPNAAGGLNLRRRLTKAKNGEYVVGNPDDVTMKKFENVSGLDITYKYLSDLKVELSLAFLLTRGATRDAERVTATEIRQVVEELEGTLGGAYSMLAQEMQAKRLELLIDQMGRNGQLPQQLDEVAEPVILTGLQALGREQDVQRVTQALQFLSGLPDAVLQDYVDWPKLLNKGMNGLHLPDAARTEQEAQQQRQQRLQAEAAQQIVQQGGQAAVRQATQQRN